LRGKRAHENLHAPSFVLQCFYMENGIIDYFGELYYECFATKLEQRSEQEARLALKLLGIGCLGGGTEPVFCADFQRT